MSKPHHFTLLHQKYKLFDLLTGPNVFLTYSDQFSRKPEGRIWSLGHSLDTSRPLRLEKHRVNADTPRTRGDRKTLFRDGRGHYSSTTEELYKSQSLILTIVIFTVLVLSVETSEIHATLETKTDS